MGHKRSQKKLQKYVERDDFAKLKSYLHKHRYSIDVNELLFDGGDTLLHLVCRHGQDHAVWYLLKRGADPLIQNEKGQVPLHHACLYALEESHYAFYDLVQPFMDKCPRAMGIADVKGKTPRQLVKEIRKKLSKKGAKNEEDTSSSEESEKEDWEERIKRETQDEYNDEWGTYEQDFADHNDNKYENETYDQWGERMRQEMHSKRQQAYERAHPERAKRRKRKEEEEKKAQEQAEFQRKLEREHQEYQSRSAIKRKQKLIQSKAKYELQCAKVFKDKASSEEKEKEMLGYSDIPWPTPSKWDKGTDTLKEFLICDMDTKDTGEVKKYLKGQQVRWHPDRFQQKCGSRLKTDDKDRIMDKVKLISQLLNSIITELDS